MKVTPLGGVVNSLITAAAGFRGAPQPTGRATITKACSKEFTRGTFRASIRSAAQITFSTSEGWDEIYLSHTFHEVTMSQPFRAATAFQYEGGCTLTCVGFLSGNPMSGIERMRYGRPLFGVEMMTMPPSRR